MAGTVTQILATIARIDALNVVAVGGPASRLRAARNSCLLREARRAAEIATDAAGLAQASALLGQIR